MCQVYIFHEIFMLLYFDSQYTAVRLCVERNIYTDCNNLIPAVRLRWYLRAEIDFPPCTFPISLRLATDIFLLMPLLYRTYLLSIDNDGGNVAAHRKQVFWNLLWMWPAGPLCLRVQGKIATAINRNEILPSCSFSPSAFYQNRTRRKEEVWCRSHVSTMSANR